MNELNLTGTYDEEKECYIFTLNFNGKQAIMAFKKGNFEDIAPYKYAEKLNVVIPSLFSAACDDYQMPSFEEYRQQLEKSHE